MHLKLPFRMSSYTYEFIHSSQTEDSYFHIVKLSFSILEKGARADSAGLGMFQPGDS